MGKIITYGSSFNSVPIDYSAIFGANYYDHWRAWDAGSLTLTGALVDSAASLTGSGRAMVGSGATRPSVIADATLGKNVFEFDGVSEYLKVNSSSGNYNFLHDGTGGMVIYVFKQGSSNPNALGTLLGNRDQSNNIGFIDLYVDAGGLNEAFRTIVNYGIGGIQNVLSTTPSGTLTVSSYNSIINILDADNATAVDRAKTYVNNGSLIANNTDTAAPSLSNATFDLYMGSRPSLSSLYLFGNLAEVIVIDTIPTPTQLSQVQARLEYDYSTFPIT